MKVCKLHYYEYETMILIIHILFQISYSYTLIRIIYFHHQIIIQNYRQKSKLYYTISVVNENIFSVDQYLRRQTQFLLSKGGLTDKT